MTVRHAYGPGALADVGPSFDRLCTSSGSPFTSRRRWLQTWVDCFPSWTPWLVLVEGDAELLAVAPLAVRRRRGVTDVVLLGHGPTDDARLPADASAVVLLAAGVVAGLPAGPWRVRLQQVPQDDPVVVALADQLRQVHVGQGQGMPLVRVSGADPAGHVSKNSRKALAKVRNRLRERALVPELRWTQEPAAVQALLPELVRVHRERDLALGRRPDHDDPEAASFYREVIVRHARADEVDLLTLHLAGDLAAYVCAFRDGRTLRSWDNRLAPRWAELSAGRLANTEAIRHVVCSPDYDALDWMRGEEPYKLQSATEVVPTSVLLAWSSPTLRTADALAATAGRRARAFLQRCPPLLRLLHRARAPR